MTDKQMAEKKKEFFERIELREHMINLAVLNHEPNAYEEADQHLWQWISKLVDEVKEELEEQHYYDSIEERP